MLIAIEFFIKLKENKPLAYLAPVNKSMKNLAV